MAIADVFDALTSHRVYRSALGVPDAIEEMRSQAGHQFDPELLDLFFGAIDQLGAIRSAHPDRCREAYAASAPRPAPTP